MMHVRIFNETLLYYMQENYEIISKQMILIKGGKDRHNPTRTCETKNLLKAGKLFNSK